MLLCSQLGDLEAPRLWPSGSVDKRNTSWHRSHRRSARTAPSPERWQHAAERAIAEGIQVRQVNASGMWVANSGSDPKVACLLEITGSLVQSCSCPAGSFGDPCCKHAARFYLDAGLLELDDPEPDAPALGGSVDCPTCHGCGVIYDRN